MHDLRIYRKEIERLFIWIASDNSKVALHYLILSILKLFILYKVDWNVLLWTGHVLFSVAFFYCSFISLFMCFLWNESRTQLCGISGLFLPLNPSYIPHIICGQFELKYECCPSYEMTCYIRVYKHKLCLSPEDGCF